MVLCQIMRYFDKIVKKCNFRNLHCFKVNKIHVLFNQKVSAKRVIFFPFLAHIKYKFFYYNLWMIIENICWVL